MLTGTAVPLILAAILFGVAGVPEGEMFVTKPLCAVSFRLFTHFTGHQLIFPSKRGLVPAVRAFIECLAVQLSRNMQQEHQSLQELLNPISDAG